MIDVRVTTILLAINCALSAAILVMLILDPSWLLASCWAVSLGSVYVANESRLLCVDMVRWRATREGRK